MAWRYLDPLAAGYPPQLSYGYDYAPIEYAGSPLSAGFHAPDHTTTTATTRNPNPETTGGPIYQTFLNCFTLAELNEKNKPFLARLTPFLPIELAAHSRPPAPPTGPLTGRSRSRDRYRRAGIGLGEAEGLREAQLRTNVTRDPRFDWQVFPKTVGWRERGEVEDAGDITTARVQDQEPTEDVDPQVEIDIDFRIDSGQADTSNLGKRKRRDVRDIGTSRNDPSSTTRRRPSDAATRQAPEQEETQDRDPAEMQRRAEELLRQAKEKGAQKRLERKQRKKKVSWVPKLYDRETAPVVASQFEYYCQWYDRYEAQFKKLENEKEAEEEKERIGKMMREGRVPLLDEAKSLEAGPPTPRRSKYNPKSNPDYVPPTREEPAYIPSFFKPTPKAGEPPITPFVPRHRQVQPVKSSIFKRASRSVADVARTMGARAVGAMRSMAAGMASFVGSGGSAASATADTGTLVPPPGTSARDAARSTAPAKGLDARVPVNGGISRDTVAPSVPDARPAVPPAPPVRVAPPPSIEQEDDKSDSERFYQAPPAAPEDDDDDDDNAFAQMSSRSAGTVLTEQRQRTAAKGKGKMPAVMVHSTRDLDTPVVETPALPEIGTGASRPVTRDNTAFNASGLDFIPLGVDDDDKLDLPAPTDRLISRLPSNASRAQREAAEANERYRRLEARFELQQRQWQDYLRSLGSLGQQRATEPFRPGDSWRDEESDVELTPDESEQDEDDGPTMKRARGPHERGRSKQRSDDKDQPEDKSNPRLHSPPPEHRLPDLTDATEDEKADFDNTVGGRLRAILEQYDKRYEPEVVHSDDSDAENPDFAGIELDDDLEEYIDDIEVPEIAAAPLYGSGFNRDRVMPKIRRPDQDREREQERKRREDRRYREVDQRRGTRWASGVPGRRSYGW